MKKTVYGLLISVGLFLGCAEKQSSTSQNESSSSYMDYSNQEDQKTGGIRMIPINTPKGSFKVWTKRVGNNPKMKVLLLHGGPGGTHELFENFDGYLPNEEIEYIYYDQLDSYYSDKPNDSTLWTIEHAVDQVEQVRKALNLDQDNFYLFGQSWGGLLAMEYALKHQDKLKGLIVANMMASIPEYEKYAAEVLGPQLPKEVHEEIKALEAKEDFTNPRYSELVTQHYYVKHVLHLPLDEWPEFINRSFSHMNPNIYIYMQGHSEFGVTGNATLKGWDISDRLNEFEVPTLMIGGKHDTMDPAYMEWMSTQVQNGRSVTTNGAHLTQYDDADNFFNGLISFIKDVNDGTF